ncbi:Chaperone protein DnaK [Cronobacter muytjensii 530]
MDAWSLLGLEPTKDKSALRRAWAKVVKQHRPDQDPQMYQRLREAYEAAQRYQEEEDLDDETDGDEAQSPVVITDGDFPAWLQTALQAEATPQPDVMSQPGWDAQQLREKAQWLSPFIVADEMAGCQLLETYLVTELPDALAKRVVPANVALLDAALDDVVLTDVMPYSLGIETARRHGERFESGYFLPIIERNSFVPVSMFRSIATVYDNQRQLEIAVFQGEARRVAENILLDKFTLDIPPRPAGEVTVDVRFTYTLDGILEVECKIDGQEDVASLVIERAPGSLSPEEIQQRLAQLNALKIHPRDRTENRQLLAQASLRYEQTLGERRHLIDHYSAQFEQALESQDLRAIADARQSLAQILAQFDDGLR